MPLPPRPITSPPIKGFILGYSGAGKSSATVPLSIAGPIAGCPAPGPGLTLRVLDFDSKYTEMAYAILGEMLRKKQISAAQHDEALARIDPIECSDNMGTVQVKEGNRLVTKVGVKGRATGWYTAAKALAKWESSLDDSTVLIVDSITYAAEAIVHLTQELNGKANQPLAWRDYMAPQDEILKFMLVTSTLPCHVLLTGHQSPAEMKKKTGETDAEGNEIEETVDVIMVPASVGKAPAIKLPARFNHMLLASSEGEGKASRRWLYTEPHNGVITKTPFFNAKPRYPISTGLVEYFALRTV